MQGSKPFRGRLNPEIWIIIGLCALAFVLNRHIVRPWVLENVVSGPVTVVVNSLPNLVEAIVGTIWIAGILLEIWRRVNCTTIYAVATVIAGLFVILSEVNWIRFRGPNVYDPNDLAASVLGLFLIYFLLARFGIYYEREAESESDDE